MELCLQLAIVFVGKILIQNNLMEIFVPYVIYSLQFLCTSLYIMQNNLLFVTVAKERYA
jgi:hypothetical protein